MVGPASFFITTKCSANVLSPVSDLNVVVANGFCNWPFDPVFEKWENGRVVDFEDAVQGNFFTVSTSF